MKVEEITKEVVVKIDDQNQNVADEFGFKALENLLKNELAWYQREEKMTKRSRKIKEEENGKVLKAWQRKEV